MHQVAGTVQRVAVRLLLVLSGLFAVGLLGQVGLGPVSTVHLRVVDPMGLQATRAHITVTDAASGKAITRLVDHFTIEKIPYGLYRFDVETPVLATRPVEIRISQPVQWVTLTFPWDPPVDRIVPNGTRIGGAAAFTDRTTIKGTVCPVRTAGGTWVKLVGVYSEYSKETACDSQGRFAFDGVPAGVYVIIATRRVSPPVTATVKCQGSDAELQLVFPHGECPPPESASPR